MRFWVKLTTKTDNKNTQNVSINQCHIQHFVTILLKNWADKVKKIDSIGVLMFGL